MVKWEDGQLVSPAHVNEDGTITPAVYEGETPLSAYNLNRMQNEIINVLQQIETPPPEVGENITLNDSKAGKFKSFEVRGNSKQDTRSGKNKLPNTAATQTINGVTITKNEDGTLLCNGTATNEISLFIGKNTLESGNYLGSIGVNGSTSTYYIRLGEGETSTSTFIANIGTGDNPFTLSEEKTVGAVLIVRKGVALSNVLIKPMVRLASITDAKYEQYGVSPSSEYPAEIKSCGDNINFFNKDSNVLVSKYFNNNGEISSNSSLNDYLQESYIDVKPNTKYTASGCTWIRICEYDTNKNFIKINNSTNSNVITITTSNTTKYLRVSFAGSLSDFKLEEGTVATPYSKFGQGNINVRTSNKNMFYSEMFNNNSTSNGITLKTMQGTNKVVLNGTATGRYTIKTNALPLNMFKIGKKYTMSKDNNYNQLANFEICENGSNTATIWNNNFVMQKSYTKIVVFMQARSGQTPTFNNQVVSLQIEEGDATAIVDHKGQAHTIPVQKPFRAIEDIKDRFIKKGGKYYEKHLVDRYVFTGNETFSLQNNGKRVFLNFITNNLENPPKNFNNTGLKHGLLCNYSNEVTAENSWNGIEGISYDQSGGFDIAINEFTTVDQYKKWFKAKYDEGNPFYIDYILAEPELIPCTEAQTAVLSDIEDNLATYDDCTHIYSTDEVPANMQCTYCKDINKLFNNIAI